MTPSDADGSGQVEDDVDPLTARARPPRLRSVVIGPVARLAVCPAALLEREAAGDLGVRPPPEPRTVYVAGEIRDRPLQPLTQRDLGLPPQQRAGAGDVG